MKFVATGEDGLLLGGPERVLHDRFIFVGAEDQPEGGVVIGHSHLLVVEIYVELKLAQVLMRELPGFEFYQDVGFEDGVIENY